MIRPATRARLNEARIFRLRRRSVKASLLFRASSQRGVVTRHHIVHRARHVEHAFGDVIDFAIEDHTEAIDRILDADVASLASGELRGDEHRLTEEHFDFPRPCDEQFIVVWEFLDTENRDNVL